MRHVVEPAERHAELLGEPDRGARGGDALDRQPFAADAIGEQPHEPARRRAGAEAEHHAVLHHLEGAGGGGALGVVGRGRATWWRYLRGRCAAV